MLRNIQAAFKKITSVTLKYYHYQEITIIYIYLPITEVSMITVIMHVIMIVQFLQLSMSMRMYITTDNKYSQCLYNNVQLNSVLLSSVYFFSF